MVSGIIFDERYLEHQTGSHVESPERLKAIMELIEKDGLLLSDSYQLIAPRPATVDEIKLIHTQDIIDRAKTKAELAKTNGLQYLDFGDTVVSAASYDVALLAAGGLLVAADKVMDGTISNAFCLVRPPGHHANFGRSSGFCIFNNIAVLAQYLLEKKGLQKVAIFDIDLHHGNGTSEIFYDRPDVLFFSSHQDGRTQYPGSGFIHEIGEGNGKGYNINIPLAPDAGDDVIEKLVKEIVIPIFEQYEPDIILGSIGGDAHYSDPLSGLTFTTQGYGNLVKQFKDVAEEYCDGRLILTLEGGYKVKVLAKSVVNILRVLDNQEMTHIDKDLKSNAKILDYHETLGNKLKKHLRDFWNL